MSAAPPTSVPRVIAHRGACGLLPEHTLEAYALAIEQGADAIELDLVPTRDGVFIARHDNDLSVTTDVADRPHFRSRRQTKLVYGVAQTGYFSEAFTSDEIRELRARQRMPFRDHSFDGRFSIPTLAEVLHLAEVQQAKTGRPPGVYLELKTPSQFVGAGPFADWPSYWNALGDICSRSGLEICIESFEAAPLRELRPLGFQNVCQLIEEPQMRPDPGSARTYADLLTNEGLEEIRTYADTIGVWKELIVPTHRNDDATFSIGAPTDLIARAHEAGLRIEAWTFRDEPRFLARDYARDYAGDPLAEYHLFMRLGIDGVIADFPATALRARLTR